MVRGESVRAWDPEKTTLRLIFATTSRLGGAGGMKSLNEERRRNPEQWPTHLGDCNTERKANTL